MKTIDNVDVTARSYYFLLDWNEKNDWEYIISQYGKEKLKDLTFEEYKQLFDYATQCDFKLMGL